jgi:7,8-dihydropterin-6-yl-methyl-4-(beta-D-ribofuranosyl)aminobenzene 5'-phosphate synthase
MPLVNWHANSANFKTEAGVSYWVETSEHTVLFDVGWNANREVPSPLQHNMNQLGLSVDKVDTVFISHIHHDHVGGSQWERQGSFSLGNTQAPLKATKAFAPIQMSYPGLAVETITSPQKLRQAIASTGPIERQLVMGRFGEQAMVVHLEGKGLLVMVGCGHQTISKLLDRVQHAFGLPIYALVGDLHYPIPSGRRTALGIDLQRLFASGQGVTKPLTIEDVKSDLKKIKETVTGLVAIGGHDTSDEVMALFERELGSRFRRVEVGTEIAIR